MGFGRFTPMPANHHPTSTQLVDAAPRRLPPTWVQVAGVAVDLRVRALVISGGAPPPAAGADLAEAQLVDVEVVGVEQLRSEHLRPGRVVAVRLAGPDAATDVGAAAALVRRGVRLLVTDHVHAVRRAVDVLAAVQEAG